MKVALFYKAGTINSLYDLCHKIDGQIVNNIDAP
jgi:hypothetical protein